MPIIKSSYLPEILYKFKVSNSHAHPVNILHVIFNKTVLNKLGWEEKTKVKVYIPVDFKWHIFLIPHQDGYKYTEYKNKIYFRFKWESTLKSPKSYMYSMQKIKLIKGRFDGKKICILDMTGNHPLK